MASYTIEDIEYIRRKSGISYQEAIALLDYHNGDVMRAMVDLERNGKLNGAPERASTPETYKNRAAHRGSFWSTRLVITGNGKPIANISILFVIIASIVSFWLVLGALVACIFLGYRISISTISDETNDRLDRMVKSAADNVKRTASSLARNVNDAIEHRQARAQAQRRAEPKEQVSDLTPDAPMAETETPAPDSPEAYVREMESYERPEVPTIQVPVKVESTDGNVVVSTDSEGFGTATIE